MNLKVSEDRRSVGWQVDTEGTAEDDEGRVLQRFTISALFVNGVKVKEVEEEGVALYDWRFRPGHRQVVFEVGPLYGGGNLFLYDIDRKRVVDTCLKRDPGVAACPEWAEWAR